MPAPTQTGESELTSAKSSQEAQAAGRTFPSELLSRIWLQSLPLVRERIACLQASVQSVSKGDLSPELRTQAADIAHKLAGSLGMFGIPEGTRIAREMEQMLEAEQAIDVGRYEELANRLRSVLNV